MENKFHSAPITTSDIGNKPAVNWLKEVASECQPRLGVGNFNHSPLNLTSPPVKTAMVQKGMSANMDREALPENEIKVCCAALYVSDWARLLLGDSFHPGGGRLTDRLGELTEINSSSRILDVASGEGTSALRLARRLGCQVVGLDFSAQLVARANARAQEMGLQGQVSFRQGDAEALPFQDHSFDTLISECAFCTFPNKIQAAHEFMRVLKRDGYLGISDLTRAGQLEPELDNMLAWIACIAEARPLDDTKSILSEAGFDDMLVESHNDALLEIMQGIKTRLIGANILVKLNKLSLEGIDLEQGKRVARAATRAVNQGQLGYAILIAKPKVEKP